MTPPLSIADGVQFDAYTLVKYFKNGIRGRYAAPASARTLATPANLASLAASASFAAVPSIINSQISYLYRLT